MQCGKKHHNLTNCVQQPKDGNSNSSKAKRKVNISRQA